MNNLFRFWLFQFVQFGYHRKIPRFSMDTFGLLSFDRCVSVKLSRTCMIVYALNFFYWYVLKIFYDFGVFYQLFLRVMITEYFHIARKKNNSQRISIIHLHFKAYICLYPKLIDQYDILQSR